MDLNRPTTHHPGNARHITLTRVRAVRMTGHPDHVGRTEAAEVAPSATFNVISWSVDGETPGGSPPKLAFYNSDPVAQPSVRAAATTAAQTTALANDLRAALIALGLVS